MGWLGNDNENNRIDTENKISRTYRLNLKGDDRIDQKKHQLKL
jgi:hypothetical protein